MQTKSKIKFVDVTGQNQGLKNVAIFRDIELPRLQFLMELVFSDCPAPKIIGYREESGVTQLWFERASHRAIAVAARTGLQFHK